MKQNKKEGKKVGFMSSYLKKKKKHAISQRTIFWVLGGICCRGYYKQPAINRAVYFYINFQLKMLTVIWSPTIWRHSKGNWEVQSGLEVLVAWLKGMTAFSWHVFPGTSLDVREDQSPWQTKSTVEDASFEHIGGWRNLSSFTGILKSCLLKQTWIYYDVRYITKKITTIFLWVIIIKVLCSVN